MKLTLKIEDVKSFLSMLSEENDEYFGSRREMAYDVLMGLLAHCAATSGTEVAAELRRHMYDLDAPRRIAHEQWLAKEQALREIEKAVALQEQEEFKAKHPTITTAKFHATWNTPVEEAK